MVNFKQAIQQQLASFTPFLSQKVVIHHACFSLTQATVEAFVQEVLHTCATLEKQQSSECVAFYTQRLVEQFDCLGNAVDELKQRKVEPNSFYSSYRFPRNIHSLPPERRLKEYQKALRALNEKISWLSEQSYLCSQEEKSDYLSAIQETEYRKQKCVTAIEQLIIILSKSSSRTQNV